MDAVKRIHMRVFGALAEERLAESFLNMVKDIKPQIAEAMHSLVGYMQRAVPRHVTLKCCKPKTENA